MNKTQNKKDLPRSQPRYSQGEITAGENHRSWWRPVALLAMVVTILVLAEVFGIGKWLEDLRNWIRTLGSLSVLVFMLIYVAAVVAALPGSVLSFAAGALFGSILGIVLVSISATIGAALAFLISRYFAREAVVRWLSTSEKFQRLDRVTEEHGAIIVALTRLMPVIPFNLLDYGFGLTRVPFWTYVFWSWLGMLPSTALYVVGADAITEGLSHGKIPWSLTGALAAVAIILFFLVRSTQSTLKFKEQTGAGNAVAADPIQISQVSPMDEYNEALLANVRPLEWENPKPVSRYNLVVIGAGTAGLVTAAGAAGLGAKVALVERHLFGGDCLNYGCVPSKAIIRSSRLYANILKADSYGLKIPGTPEVDFPAVMERMRRLRAGISKHDSVKRFQEMGIDVFLGAAQFLGPDSVEVAGQTLKFKKAVIATGGRAAHPSLKGLEEAGFLTNESVFNLTQRPERLLVIGAGPIGCELAQAMQRLGCQVTLLHKHDHIMNKEDTDAAELIQNVFLKEGINLILKAKPLRVYKNADAKVIQYESNGKPAEIAVDEILVGAGRAPNVEGLNLEAAGVKYEGGRGRGVIVDDNLQTTNPDIYAAGDICLPYQFTHLADASARIVIQNALFFGRKKLSALTIPWCTYTDPEVAHVGLSESEAQKKGVAVQSLVKPLREVDRAILDGEDEGFIKILVKAGTDKILGATIVARHAGEMVSEVSAAMVGNLGLKDLAAVIHPYPTQAEAIRQTGDLYNRTRLTPRVKYWLSRYLAWRR